MGHYVFSFLCEADCADGSEEGDLLLEAYKDDAESFIERNGDENNWWNPIGCITLDGRAGGDWRGVWGAPWAHDGSPIPSKDELLRWALNDMADDFGVGPGKSGNEIADEMAKELKDLYAKASGSEYDYRRDLLSAAHSILCKTVALPFHQYNASLYDWRWFDVRFDRGSSELKPTDALVFFDIHR